MDDSMQANACPPCNHMVLCTHGLVKGLQDFSMLVDIWGKPISPR